MGGWDHPEQARRRSASGGAWVHFVVQAKGRTPWREDRPCLLGGAEGIRTPGLLVANEARYQLRHSPRSSLCFPCDRETLTRKRSLSETGIASTEEGSGEHSGGGMTSSPEVVSGLRSRGESVAYGSADFGFFHGRGSGLRYYGGRLRLGVGGTG
jgi:hypothetical protein